MRSTSVMDRCSCGVMFLISSGSADSTISFDCVIGYVATVQSSTVKGGKRREASQGAQAGVDFLWRFEPRQRTTSESRRCRGAARLQRILARGRRIFRKSDESTGRDRGGGRWTRIVDSAVPGQ